MTHFSFKSTALMVALVSVLMFQCVEQANCQSADEANFSVRFVDSVTGYGIQPDEVTIVGEQSGNEAKKLNRGQFAKSGKGALMLKPGRYKVSVNSERYRFFSADVDVNSSTPFLNRIVLDPVSEPDEVKGERIDQLRREGAMLVLGFIVDDETGEPLEGVVVSSMSGGVKTESNARGFFEFHVPVGDGTTSSLSFEKAGYETEERESLESWSKGDVIYNIRLNRGTGSRRVDENQFRRRAPARVEKSVVDEATVAKPTAEELSALNITTTGAIVARSGSPTNRMVRIPRTIRVFRELAGTIDYVSLQTYCKRSLPAEWYSSWAENYVGGSNSLNSGAVAIRTYAIGFVNSPRNGIGNSYDICDSTSCQVYNPGLNSTVANRACDFTVGQVMVNSSVRIPRGLTEYSSENNSLGFSCGDGYTQPTSGCIFDPVCTGATRFGHGRGVCQWGTARWATGLKFPNNNFSNTNLLNGFPRQDWKWILNHYYPDLTLVQGAELVISDDVKVTGASVQVRMCGDGTVSSGVNCPLITTKAVGATGVIIDGPTQVISDGMGYTWWKIQWSDSTIGWSPENWIERVIPSPAAPTGLSAVAMSTNRIDLTWAGGLNLFEDGFSIERAPGAGGPWVEIKTVASGVTNYSDLTLAGAGVYFYRVRSFNVTGDSAYSNVASAIPHLVVNEGSTIVFTNFAAAPETVEYLTDFEGYSVNAAVMFRLPGLSGSSVGIDASPNVAAVTGTFPANGTNNTRALNVNWGFNTTTNPNPWLRLTTSSTANLPNPVIDFTKRLRFDIYSDKNLFVGLGLRETVNPPGTPIGSDGGGTGAIEWVGITNKTGFAPNPTRMVTGGSWSTLTFNLPTEPVLNFVSGNGVLSTASGLGVLEHLAFVPGAGVGTYNVYLDNFAVVQAKTLTYSLDAGAPAGASINPTTGVFTWSPSEAQGPSTNQITVRATDNSVPAQSDTWTLTVIVNEVNQAPVLAAIANRTLHAGMTLAVTNAATDPDIPANVLTYSIDPGAPVGVGIDGISGVLTWTPQDAQIGNNLPITVRVKDNGTPSMSDAKTFNVTVLPKPTIQNPVISGSNITLTWPTIPGTVYRVQYKTNLNDPAWSDLLPSVTAGSTTASKVDSIGDSERYYRILVVTQ